MLCVFIVLVPGKGIGYLEFDFDNSECTLRGSRALSLEGIGTPPPFPQSTRTSTVGEAPAYVDTPEKYVKQLGVEAEIIDNISHIVPPILQDGQQSEESSPSGAVVGSAWGGVGDK